MKKSARPTITLGDTVYETTFTRNYLHRKPYVPKDPKRLRAVIPGLILELLVVPGEQVRPGQSLLILEAMKMQNHLTAQTPATIRALCVAAGDTVVRGQLLIEFE